MVLVCPPARTHQKAHGSPPGDEELNGAKEKLGWPVEPRFFVPDDVLDFYRHALETGKEKETGWNKAFDSYKAAYPEQAETLKDQIAGKLPENWAADLPKFPADAKGMASRKASGAVLNALATNIRAIIGGSADLTPSNNTWLENSSGFPG